METGDYCQLLHSTAVDQDRPKKSDVSESCEVRGLSSEFLPRGKTFRLGVAQADSERAIRPGSASATCEETSRCFALIDPNVEDYCNRGDSRKSSRLFAHRMCCLKNQWNLVNLFESPASNYSEESVLNFFAGHAGPLETRNPTMMVLWSSITRECRGIGPFAALFDYEQGQSAVFNQTKTALPLHPLRL